MQISCSFFVEIILVYLLLQITPAWIQQGFKIGPVASEVKNMYSAKDAVLPLPSPFFTFILRPTCCRYKLNFILMQYLLSNLRLMKYFEFIIGVPMLCSDLRFPFVSCCFRYNKAFDGLFYRLKWNWLTPILFNFALQQLSAQVHNFHYYLVINEYSVECTPIKRLHKWFLPKLTYIFLCCICSRLITNSILLS